jgi:type II secretory pathway component PulM
MSFIDNLQNKSPRTKAIILWVASAAVMVIIFAIWVANFSNNISPTKGLEQTQLPSLFKSIGQDISTLKQGLNASIGEIKDQTNQLESASQTNP